MKMAIDINFMIGGEAGQGVQSVGFILAKTFASGGYDVFVDQDYESRVRGGHNFYRVRVKDTEVGAIAAAIDVLIALNKESIDLHKAELSPHGVIIYDGDRIKVKGRNITLLAVPLEKLAEEQAGNKMMGNTVALGAAIGLVDYDYGILSRVLLDHFGSGDVGEANVKAARAGYQFVKQNFKADSGKRLRPIGKAAKMLLNGNEAIATGAIAAGCKFMSAYPMTPASSIMEYLAGKSKDLDLVVVQAEDEISAINMIIGASYAGVRSMTATSGGGFCLMVEGIGLAGITETPVVVVNAQRPGPAIGLPTRTEQGDLEFVLHASHGEFPRAVFAPATVEDAFWLTIKAFNIADKYQLPVIMLTDQYLASSYTTADKFDISKVAIDRGSLFTEENAADYRRHKIPDSGISPRAFPPLKGTLVVTDSDEHDEKGHLIEDAETRTKMMQKRLNKLEGLKNEIAPPLRYGPEGAETVLIGWGSTYGAIREAVDILNGESISTCMVHLNEIWPFPTEPVTYVLDHARRAIVIENNATGQLARLIRRETGKPVNMIVVKFDGRPFSPIQIVNEVRKEV
jgi:2-oxoglutarate ferredoxin oxidoreductase subunit alpha